MTRLFIPGPTDVAPDVLEAQARPMIGHRTPEFKHLYDGLQPRLQQVFQTESRVYLAASSGSGLMEGAMRSLISRRALLCVCGAFGHRWTEVAEANGLAFDRLDAEWGQPNLADQVVQALQATEHDTLVVVHNETSTGVENPVAEIAARARRHRPELMIVVDAVSSAGGVDIRTDEWGLDVVISSSQKCFALPPGLAFAAVNDRALERAGQVSNRGWYFDLLLLEKYHQRSYTPATPAISMLYALDRQLDRMLQEGLAERFTRHQELADLVHDWTAERFALFAAEGHRSRTVSSIRNTRQLDIAALNRFLGERGMTLANGYGKLKDQTFRIGHMGETQTADLHQLLDAVDEYLT